MYCLLIINLFSVSISAAETVFDAPLLNNIFDESSVKHKIMKLGSPEWIQLGTNSFLEFNGKDDALLIEPDAGLKLQDFAFSLWLKPYSSVEPLQGIIKGAYGDGNYNGFRIMLFKHGTDSFRAVLYINFGDRKPRVFSFGLIPKNKFTNLAFIYDHKNVSLFVNGVKIKTGTENRDINYSAKKNIQLRLGRSSGRCFKGIITSVKIFTKDKDEKFLSILFDKEKQMIKVPDTKDVPLKKYYAADNSASVSGITDSIPRKMLLIDYRFDSGKGLKIKDHSPFHNDAEVMGAEYGGVAGWQRNGGLIISSCGAHIPGSSIITPENFSLQLDFKLLKAVNHAEIFSLFVTPFYLKDRTLTWKNKEKLFYPVYNIFSVQIIGKDRIRAAMLLKDKNGKLVKKQFTSKASLNINKFSKCTITFNEDNLTIIINGKQQTFSTKGTLYYEHPQLYPGHVNALLGGRSVVEYKDLKFYSLDNPQNKKPEFAIKIKTPHFLNFFTNNEPKIIDIGISSFGNTIRRGSISVKCTDHNGKEVYKSSFPVVLKPLRENNYQLNIPQDTRGCFWIDVVLTDNDGNVIAKRSNQYSIGAIRNTEEIPPTSPFGYCYTFPEERCADFGEKWKRVNVCWLHIEPEKNKFDFSRLDKLINYNYKKKNKIYMMFMAWAPSWITGGKARQFINPDNEDHFKYYERMVRKVLNRYKGKISGYDIIGEANAHECFRKSPEFYTRIAKIFHKVKQECDPDAFIGGPSAWRGGWDQPTERFLKAGAGKYWDVLDTHYIGGSGGYYLIPEESVIGGIKGSREMLAKYGLKLPIIDSETGYVACSRGAEDSRPMSKSQLQKAISREELYTTNFLWSPHLTKYMKTSHDEITAAQFTVRRMILCLSEGVNLHLRHNVGAMTYNSEINPRFLKSYNTGVLLPGIAWSNMIEKLSAAKFVRKIPMHDKNMYAYLFYDTKNKKYLAVLWSFENKRSVLINADSLHPELFDIWGNPIKCEFVRNNLLLELTESPVYLENVGGNIAEAETILTVSLPKTVVPDKLCKILIELKNSENKSINWTVDLFADNNVELDKKHFTVSLQPGKIKNIMTSFLARGSEKGKLNIKIRLNSNEYGEIIKNVSAVIQKSPTPIYKAPGKISLDGDFSDWPASSKNIYLGNKDQVRRGLNSLDVQHFNPDRDWVGPKDLSGIFRLCWDAENLYVFAKITDPERNILKRGDEIRATDGFELFLDGRNPNELGDDPYNILKGVRHCFISPGAGNSDKALIRIKGPMGEKIAGLIQSATKITPDGYIVEMKIPIQKQYFPYLDMETGRIIGMNIYINDADKLPIAKSTIVWQGNAESNRKPSDFGQIILK